MSEPTPSPACNDCDNPITPGEQWTKGTETVHCPPCAESTERVAESIADRILDRLEGYAKSLESERLVAEKKPALTAFDRGYRIAAEIVALTTNEPLPLPWDNTVAAIAAKQIEEACRDAVGRALEQAATVIDGVVARHAENVAPATCEAFCESFGCHTLIAMAKEIRLLTEDVS